MSRGASGSDFKKILGERRKQQGGGEGTTAERDSTTFDIKPTPTHAPEPTPQKRRVGRPNGKKSDPMYRQVTIYIPVELYKHIWREIVEGEKKLEFSEIVEKALWHHCRLSDGER